MQNSVWSQLPIGAVVSRLSEATGGWHVWCKRREFKPLALIVDDDPDIAPLVNVALSPYAILTDNVYDGATALTQLRQHRYDLVILDLGLEGLHGFDVLLALKKEIRLRGIPVIVITANASDEFLARSFGYGADDFVIKPFKPNELGMRAYRLLHPATAR
jgi:DNA-binding response OmpR family regulator